VTTRLVHAWDALSPERRLAAIAAVGLFATMLLPWYQQNGFRGPHSQPSSNDLNAFAVFSFVEAAILLVAAGVLVLLYARAERRDFHLPGGDGTVVMGAGAWAGLLLIWRLFDKPSISGRDIAATVGIQWGIFLALGAAGLLAYAGSRMRATRRPEPPLVAPEEPTWEHPPPGTTRTRVLPPERPSRRHAPPPVIGDQLTMPLGVEPTLGEDER
jgi:hypothetical protein